MATKKIIITGVQAGRGPNNSTQVRMDINTYLADADRKNLYLLGLERLQARPQTDMRSWYQIAGIHGRPYTPWDGEGNQAGQKPGGYCTHSSALFLTWHRPYLALIEQVLYDDIQAVVNSFPAGAKRDRLAKVALTFRLPYWDWAANPAPHPLLLQRTVSVEKATGVVTIPNPLYSYRFHNTNDFPAGRYRNWRQTLRHPASATATESQDSVFARINRDLEAKDTEDRFGGRRGTMVNIRERVWLLLNVEQNRYPTFAAFSNDRWAPNGRSSDYDSLESVHNSLHGMIGGGGHMGDPGYAAFDPVFWLHHANVDRIWALWQALHPEPDLNWDFGETAETQHTFNWWNLTPGSREEENTPLKPFHRTNTAYWDSNSVRDLKQFGYTYPELTEWNAPNVTRIQLRSKVAVMVRNLYATKTTTGSLLNAGRATPQAAPLTAQPAARGPFVSLASIPTEGVPPAEKKPNPEAAAQRAAPQNRLQAAVAASSTPPPQAQAQTTLPVGAPAPQAVQQPQDQHPQQVSAPSPTPGAHPGVQAEYGQQQPVYGQPQQVYGQPQPVYGQPQPVYGQQQPVYGQPQPVYGQPQPVYGQPQPVYGQPQPVYGQQQPVYGQQQPVYGQPQTAPQPVYGQPQTAQQPPAPPPQHPSAAPSKPGAHPAPGQPQTYSPPPKPEPHYNPLHAAFGRFSRHSHGQTPPPAGSAAPAGPGAQQPHHDSVQEAIARAAEAAKTAARQVAADPRKALHDITRKTVSSIEKYLGVPLPMIIKNDSHREYFANIRAPKYTFGGSYFVHVFIGPFTENYAERQFDKNLVGSVYVFANDIGTTGCENCKKNAAANLVVTGAVPLTSALLERIDEVGSLEPADVEPYLKKNLHWRIHHGDAQHDNIDRRDAAALQFAVTSVVVEHPTQPDGLPVYRDWNPIPGITAGRPTGAGYEDAEGYEA